MLVGVSGNVVESNFDQTFIVKSLYMERMLCQTEFRELGQDSTSHPLSSVNKKTSLTLSVY